MERVCFSSFVEFYRREGKESRASESFQKCMLKEISKQCFKDKALLSFFCAYNNKKWLSYYLPAGELKVGKSRNCLIESFSYCRLNSGVFHVLFVFIIASNSNVWFIRNGFKLKYLLVFFCWWLTTKLDYERCFCNLLFVLSA